MAFDEGKSGEWVRSQRRPIFLLISTVRFKKFHRSNHTDGRDNKRSEIDGFDSGQTKTIASTDKRSQMDGFKGFKGA